MKCYILCLNDGIEAVFSSKRKAIYQKKKLEKKAQEENDSCLKFGGCMPYTSYYRIEEFEIIY